MQWWRLPFKFHIEKAGGEWDIASLKTQWKAEGTRGKEERKRPREEDPTAPNPNQNQMVRANPFADN